LLFLCKPVFLHIMKYNTTTLPNGLRIIQLPSASPVVYCGFAVNAGAADEAPDCEGLAHFCEHTTFKGTARRNSLDIINSLESVGGELNAFTTKTDTVYYAAILKEYLPRAVDLLADIVFHSTYPQTEIDKEVEVICDEIESYNDSPSELIYDEFENIIFRGTPLGHNILGTSERVRAFKTADALRFTRQYYRPDNVVFFVYGGRDLQVKASPSPSEWRGCLDTLKAIEPHPSTDCKGNQSLSRTGGDRGGLPRGAKGGFFKVQKDTHQAHVMLGTQAYGVDDDRRIALYLLNNIIGGPGMNARLNLNLRESHGLVYTVESMMVNYATTGLWGVYFGCDPKDVDKCLKLTRQELDKAMEKRLTEEEINAAKLQIKGQIGIACDNRENFAIDFAKSYLHYGWEKDINKLFQRIDALTPQQLQDVAQDIFQEDKITTLVVE